MSTHSRKLKSVMALFLVVVMTVSVLGTGTRVNAAPTGKYVKSLKVASKKTLTSGEKGTVSATVKVKGSASKKVTVKSSNKKVVTAKAGKPNKKGVSKIILTAKSVSKKTTATVTVTTSAKNSKKKKITKKIKVTVKPASQQPTTQVSGTQSSGTQQPTTQPGGTQQPTTVQQPEIVKVTQVELDTATMEMTVNQTSTLKATVIPASATNRKVTWSSSDSNVASVSAEGVVTAQTKGEAVITVTTEDGNFTAECKVIVKDTTIGIADGLSIEVTNALEKYSDSMKNEYVVMTGDDANVRVRLVKDGQPVGNQSVKLETAAQYGNAADLYKIEGDRTSKFVTTDADGFANFPISLTEKYSGASATDPWYESYRLKASVSGDGNVIAEATLLFGQVYIEEVFAVNDVDSEYPDLVLGENAMKSGAKSISSTASKNGAFDVQYITSQQVTGKENHAVTMATWPVLRLPATASEVKTGEYEDNTVGKKSGSYSVYNDENNETTTTIIETIPAGLEWASIYFNSIELSKYTKLSIKFYKKDEDGNQTKTLVEEKVINEKNLNQDARTVQIPVQKDVAVYAVIALISEGQVNDDKNEGYEIANIRGEWATTNEKLPRDISLDNTVKWEADKNFSRSSSENDGQLSFEEAKKYLPVDSIYLESNYTYSYSVPSFPSVGNAVIYVKNQSYETIAYYMYPTVNKQDQIGNYLNVNDIAPSNYKQKAVLVSEQEVNNRVGTLQQNGNFVTVDSTSTGYTPLKATIDLADLGVTDISNGTAYTYIQWAPYYEKQDEIIPDDFYALLGQNVKVTAQLCDVNNNPVTQAGHAIAFEVAGEQNLSDFIVNEDTFTAKTDATGKCVFEVTNRDGLDYLEGLAAKSEGYKVRISIGDRTVDTATIHWVNVGLYFKDAAEGTVDTTNSVEVFSETQEVTENMRRTVGDNWIFGMKAIGNLPEIDKENSYAIIGISDIDIMFDKIGEGTGTETENGVYTLKSNVIGDTTLTGRINGESVGDNVEFTIAEVDASGEVIRTVGTFENVGTGVSRIMASIDLKINWSEKGMNQEIVSPLGNVLDVTTATAVYIKVTDDFGNVLANKNVTYKISGLGLSIEDNKVTDENGLIQIDLDAPNKAGDITITSTVENATSSAKITYTESKVAEPLSVTSATIDKSGEAITVAVEFSAAIKSDSINAEEFTLTDGDKIYNIKNAVISEESSNIVILTLTDKEIANVNLSKVSLTVDTYENNHMQMQIKDVNNRVLPAKAVVNVTSAK